MDSTIQRQHFLPESGIERPDGVIAAPLQYERPLDISAKDWRQWRCVQAVTVYQFEHASGDGKLCSVVVACRAVGVSRSMYYRAQQNPYVKRRIAEEMMTRDMLVGQTISSHWLDVVEAQIRIAMNPENRGSTRAASFLAGLMREHEDRLTDMVMHPTCHGLASD